MQSDAAVEPGVEVVDRALAALSGRIDEFHAAVEAAEREVRDHVLTPFNRSAFREEQALVELGPFALGRIDPGRFAMLLSDDDSELTPETVEVVQRADSVLRAFAESTSVHRVRVDDGGDLRDSVKDALAEIGRLFGASRAVERARAGTFDAERDGALLGPLPFRSWNRQERQLAPPLVVELRGEDCLPAGLGEFLDGSVRIVLVVRGPTTPAPLARLVTPGTFVMQTADPDDLERMAASAHPGVALVFDQPRPEQAWFVHDPDAGDASWARLTVTQLPPDEAVGRGRRPPVWLEDLVHLKALAAAPARVSTHVPPEGRGEARAGPERNGAGGSPAAEPSASSAPPADKLAAWLLAQTDVSDL